MSRAEQSFRDFLQETVKDQYIIETKIALNDLIKRYGWLDHNLWTMHNFGHIDFVLLDPKSKHPVLCIELDDKTHDRPDRQERDERKNDLLLRADLPLLRFRKGKRWGDEERKAIWNALG